MSFAVKSFASKARFALATLAIGGTTLAAATAASTTAAEARRIGIRVGVLHVHRHAYLKPRFVVPVATVAVVGGSCAAYRWRAEAYNSAYWWERYKDCKGW